MKYLREEIKIPRWYHWMLMVNTLLLLYTAIYHMIGGN